ARRLRTSLSKGRDDGFISEHLNRAISRPISMLLARTPITPNQITIASFLLGLLGAALLALADSTSWIAGGLIIQASSILDGCDGEVARLKCRQSARGGWLDTVLDRYADAALAIAVTLSAARAEPASWIWIAGCASAVGFLMASYCTKEYQIRFGKPYPNTLVARLKRRDLRILIVAIGAIAGYPFEALLVVGLLSHLSVFWILVAG
ncbi:MAG: CDP-alcohol phosphatidyltransferase family protein, partial [Planctomycetota bacterium]